MARQSDTTGAASEVAEGLLAGSDRRWDHVRGVAARAAGLGLPQVVVAAAWLHDVGYADALRDTGMHAIDGARYLRRTAWPATVVSLVAWHTGADAEACERGLSEALDDFERPPHDLADALTLCDLSVSPAGADITVPDRLAEIFGRYPENHPVHRSVSRSHDELVRSCQRALGRLGLSEGWGLTAL